MPPRKPPIPESTPDLSRPPLLSAPYLSQPIHYLKVPNYLSDWHLSHGTLASFPIERILNAEKDKCESLERQVEYHVDHREIMSEEERDMSKEVLLAALKVAIDAVGQWREILGSVVEGKGSRVGREVLKKGDWGRWEGVLEGLCEVQRREEGGLREFDEGSGGS